MSLDYDIYLMCHKTNVAKGFIGFEIIYQSY